MVLQMIMLYLWKISWVFQTTENGCEHIHNFNRRLGLYTSFNVLQTEHYTTFGVDTVDHISRQAMSVEKW